VSPRQKKSELVHISKSPIPAWHQSTEVTTACPLLYVTGTIKGKKKPGGMESARGNQVHRTGSEYASWCAHKEVAMDLEAFDRFARGAGPEAAKILAGMRESYKVDFLHLFATEVPMSLDENFQPTDVFGSLEGTCKDSELPSAYTGVLDALYMFREESKAVIDDLKTHFFPYDPDKYLQGKTYCTFVFQHFPWVNEITFRLIFVRYRNMVRSVSYTRDDLPALIEEIKAARARQVTIHEAYDAGKEIEVYPGPHCLYCPLLSDHSCPIGKYNEYEQLSWEERAKFALWYPIFSKVNNAVMKARVQETGKPIVLKDFNGKIYQFGPVDSEGFVFPLFQATANGIAMDKEGNPSLPIVSLLMDHVHAFPDDTKWLGDLTISSTKLMGPLKSSKSAKTSHRVITKQAIEDTAEKVTKIKFQAKPLEKLPDENEEPDEDGEDSEDNEF